MSGLSVCTPRSSSKGDEGLGSKFGGQGISADCGLCVCTHRCCRVSHWLHVSEFASSPVWLRSGVGICEASCGVHMGRRVLCISRLWGGHRSLRCPAVPPRTGRGWRECICARGVSEWISALWGRWVLGVAEVLLSVWCWGRRGCLCLDSLASGSAACERTWLCH